MRSRLLRAMARAYRTNAHPYPSWCAPAMYGKAVDAVRASLVATQACENPIVQAFAGPVCEQPTWN